MTTEPEDGGVFMGIPPRRRYVPALTWANRWCVRDRATDLLVPDSTQFTEAEAWAVANSLNEAAARKVMTRPVRFEGVLSGAEVNKALKDLEGKLREASATGSRAKLHAIFGELQHLAHDAKLLVTYGGSWELGE